MMGYSCFAGYYDLLTGNIDYRRRAGYFDALLRRFDAQPSGLLLDLACGTGSLSLELCALGYEVIGVDASAEMLSVAIDKATKDDRRILFLQQRMTNLDLYGTVDYAVCALDSLNHLPSEQALEATLARLALFIAPGGLFVFDVNTAYKHSEILADNVFVYDLDSLYCVWQNHCGPDLTVEISLDFFTCGQDHRYSRVSESFCERIFSPETLACLLKKHGFFLLASYGDDSLLPPQATTQRVVYVAQRQ